MRWRSRQASCSQLRDFAVRLGLRARARVRLTYVAVEALGNGRGETERCFLLLPTSFGVAMAGKAGSGGLRYQEVVVGPQDFRSWASHFRRGKLGLSMFLCTHAYSLGFVLVQLREQTAYSTLETLPVFANSQASEFI